MASNANAKSSDGESSEAKPDQEASESAGAGSGSGLPSLPLYMKFCADANHYFLKCLHDALRAGVTSIRDENKRFQAERVDECVDILTCEYDEYFAELEPLFRHLVEQGSGHLSREDKVVVANSLQLLEADVFYKKTKLKSLETNFRVAKMCLDRDEEPDCEPVLGRFRRLKESLQNGAVTMQMFQDKLQTCESLRTRIVDGLNVNENVPSDT